MSQHEGVKECKICEVLRHEEPVYADGICSIYKTLKMKGHEVRLMVVLNEHIKHCKYYWTRAHCRDKLKEAIKNIIGNKEFIIMSPTHSTIQDHWHLVGCDLIPGIEDTVQVIDTDAIYFFKSGGNAGSGG